MLIFMKYLYFFILVNIFIVILGHQVLEGLLFRIFNESLILFDVNIFWQAKGITGS